MAKTLIARISNAEQYQQSAKKIIWELSSEKAKNKEYDKLAVGDNAVFTGAGLLQGKVLIGTIEKINPLDNIVFKDITEINCSNDQLLQLHEFYPETVSRIKANFQPYLHPKEININKLIEAAKAKRFISFYVFADYEKFESLKTSLRENDRVLILNSDGTFGDLKLLVGGKLVEDSEIQTISVKGYNLDKILEMNKAIQRESKVSNNENRIIAIKESLQQSGYFKFNSFFSYYDTVFNKKVYVNGAKTDSDHRQVELSPGNSIYKISMSPKPSEINEDIYNDALQKQFVMVSAHTGRLAGSKTSQGDIFSKEMKVGDLFYLCRGNRKIELLGRITGNSQKSIYEEYASDAWLQRPFEIVAKSIKPEKYSDKQKWWTPNHDSTCVRIPEKEIDLANKLFFKPYFNTSVVMKKQEKKNNIPLNQILYGPPGTGKTYNAIPLALKIIEPDFQLKDTYTSDEWHFLKEKFDTYQKSGQIEFVTFHQSMCYEDFVEGIKPLDPKDSEGLQYDVVPGIFKRICDAASGGKEISFEKAYDLFIEELSIKGQIELKTPSDRKGFIVRKNGAGNCSAFPKTDKAAPMTITRNTILKYLKNPDEQFWRSYAKPIFDYIEGKYFRFDSNSYNKKYVLIIDEINRGNVSAIFGELITLLEPAKRVGGAEHLKIKLPYSKTDFEVPANLYIIGTMNTADRSVEALDTALRRRFSFVEMPPLPDLIEEKTADGIRLREILTTINSRIEILLDKDHLIGHSYFINVKSAGDLQNVFHNNIIPLLQEYFYGDYGKIGLVLGEGFFEKPIDSQKSSFSKFYDYDSSGLEERQIYKLRNVEKMSIEDFVIAVNTLLK